jgi:replicative DNA helicase
MFGTRRRTLVIIRRREESGLMKRPIFIIDTAGKSKEEMKATARQALQKFQELAARQEPKAD